MRKEVNELNPVNYAIPMLELYCEWLNKWTEAEHTRLGEIDPPHHYELHQFMVTDREKNLWGDCNILCVCPNGVSGVGPRFHVTIACTDGDDGGPTELTAWFEIAEDNTTEIVAMVQGFDTNLQFIYEDRQFKNVPE